MPLLQSLLARAARELAQNPEARAQAKRVVDEEVAPRARKFAAEHRGDFEAAKKAALRGAAGFALKIKKNFQDG